MLEYRPIMPSLYYLKGWNKVVVNRPRIGFIYVDINLE